MTLGQRATVLAPYGLSSVSSSSASSSALHQQTRTVMKHPSRVILGHKMEITRSNSIRKRPSQPSKYPVHPQEADQQNIKLLTTYADLRLRWTYGQKWSKGWRIARYDCFFQREQQVVS